MSWWAWVPNPWAGLDPVFVDDPERAEAHVPGVMVAGEGEGVAGVEPAVVGVAAVDGFAEGDHGGVASLSLDSRALGLGSPQ